MGLLIAGAAAFIQGFGLWTNSLADRVPFLLGGLGLFGLAYLYKRFLPVAR
jgi:hypothetical protein